VLLREFGDRAPRVQTKNALMVGLGEINEPAFI
jgi:lipoate synthase